MGGGSSSFQKPDDDGLHDVDGWQLTVHLFSIGITFSASWQPISALQSVGKVFEPYKDSGVDTLAPKLLFIALNLAGLGLGLWKLNTLGLLPTHPSDWVSSLAPAPSRSKVHLLRTFQFDMPKDSPEGGFNANSMIHSSNSESLRQPFVPCIAEMDEENVALGKRLKLVSDNHSKEAFPTKLFFSTFHLQEAKSMRQSIQKK
ncbi:hypothetical protein HPP92_021652 [Vanilla planifolia]|uniref:ER membrane protein complex subunit 4 n=1 Tax=Vanilla planifolia TaxID=51239 RepID=A0A835PXK9_VANPL|nr:hypothetical protein HPP92_021971 [Vanilla planifolia]KAG0463176.1 hypothetical protein HPP92_021652 [Vanilla planifolia]